MSFVCQNHPFPFNFLGNILFNLPSPITTLSTGYKLPSLDNGGSLSVSLMHFDVHSECTMENPNSLREEASSVFTHVPSSLLGVIDDGTLLSHLVPPQYHEINVRGSGFTQTDNFINTDTIEPMIPPKKRSNGAIYPNPKKNTSTRKKDRHSKICTAQGLRARRMRLSVQIARRFFDLQDMLGFDKASKTIEWLFAKSTSAIRELGLSGMEEAAKYKASMEAPIILNDNQKEKKWRKSACSYLIGNKESRDKARARARERTREKMFIRNLELFKQYHVEGRKPLNDLEAANQLFSHSHGKSSTHENIVASANLLTSGSVFNFQNNIRAVVSDGEDSSNNFVGILENWQMDSERINSDYCALTTNMVPIDDG